MSDILWLPDGIRADDYKLEDDAIQYVSGVRLGSSDVTDDDAKRYFSAVISNDSRDSHYSIMDPETSLRNYAEDAANGVPIMRNHDYKGLPIGRSISGTFDPKTNRTLSDFYLQTDLPEAQDVIKRIDGGSLRDTSVGFSDGKEYCNFCSERMHWFFGDRNGHYPGMEIMVDADGDQVYKESKSVRTLTIDTTIKEARLVEFSPVWAGSTPGAEIIEKMRTLYMSRVIDDGALDWLSNRYNVRMRSLLDPKTNKTYFDIGGKGMANPNDLQIVVDDLQTKNTKLTEERDALQAKVDEMEGKLVDGESLEEAQEVIDDLRTKLKAAEQRAKELEPLANEGEAYVLSMREKVKKADVKANPDKTPDERTAFNEMIDGMVSVDAMDVMLGDRDKEITEKYTARKSVSNPSDGDPAKVDAYTAKQLALEAQCY